MKVTITEPQLREYFKHAMSDIDCGIINEALTPTDKSDIKSLVKKEIKDFLENTRSIELETKVGEIIKNKIKNDKDVEKYLVDVTRNVLIQLYKNLWTRRNFWSSDLKNSSS